MLNRFIGDKWLHRIFISLYVIVAVFLPFNKVVLSLATALLFVSALLATTWTELKETLRVKRSFLPLLLLFAWSIISILWSKDTAQGWKYINLTLPFYLILISFILHPLRSKKELKIILNSFLIAITTVLCVNLFVHFQMEDHYNYDMRELSLFSSHIRLAIMVVIGMVVSVQQFMNSRSNFRWIYFVLVLFFLFYTIYSEVISAYISFVAVLLTSFIYWIHSRVKNKVVFYSFLIFVLIGSVGTVVVVVQKILEKPEIVLLEKTKQGNIYWSDTVHISYENGHPIGVNIQFDELYAEWLKFSSIDLYDSARNGYTYMDNLIRYMTSKGLVKDAEGLHQLTKEDIEKIENGYVSILQDDQSFRTRFVILADELAYKGNDPNGYSLLQRIEYWKAGIHLFAENFWIGIGAGSSNVKFPEHYERVNSKLTKDNQRNSHQQLLTMGVNYGIVGFTLFLLLLIFFFVDAPKQLYIYCIFFILIASFLNEDTMETQTGATMLAFFFGLFASVRTNGVEEKQSLNSEHRKEEK